MRRSKILSALRQLTNAELSEDYLMQFFNEIGALHNDRGAALLLARHLEDALALAIVERLRVDPRRFDDLFGYDRPAGSFDNKLRLAHAVGLITEETRLTINTVKLIRNAFAHALNPISFNTPQLADACALIEVPKAFPPTSSGLASYETEESGLSENRRRYQRACDVISHNLFVVAGLYVRLTGTAPPANA